jgi:hypothetical protein
MRHGAGSDEPVGCESEVADLSASAMACLNIAKKHSLLCHPHFATNSKQMYVHLLSREEFCNEFARELLLPEEKIKGISLAPAEEAWSEGERRTHRRNSDQSRHMY